MYGIDLSVQTENMMPFIGLGMSLAVAYDIFGFVRSIFAGRTIISFVLDFSYCILAAGATYLLFLGTTSGVIRFYLLLSELTGAVVYFMTAGRLAGRISAGISAVMNKIFGIFPAVFSQLKSKLRASILKISEKLRKKHKKHKNKLKKCLKHTD